ncbi:hypothetical protein [Nannocystis bainbridge]|uniref:Uncharacterized protein n=1 Tax=Nannocystis bainbridge TaxID=2995303 RepID=A0ABT5DTM3_9BACT|nr:hypothetical protein [Nannocystis bainbridge]MDC0716488.1 hypothetical protein [Nannocystis bainbridge]
MHEYEASITRTAKRSLVALAIAAAACEAEVEAPFVPRYATERLRIGTSFEAELCQEVMDGWEAQIDAIEAMLGVSREYVWLYLYADEELAAIGADCGRDHELRGCYKSPVVRTTLEVAAHEIVHAWTAMARSNPLTLLKEGIAVRLQGNAQRTLLPLTVEDLAAAVPWEKYPSAGHFVAWLIETYGVERFMDLYVRSSRGMQPAAISALFVEVLGSSSQAVMDDYSKHSKQYYPGAGGLACGTAEPIEWQGDSASWTMSGACATGGWYALSTDFGRNRRTLELAEDGRYAFETGGRVFSLLRCLSEPADEDELPILPRRVGDDVSLEPTPESVGLIGEQDNPLELPAGTYEIWVWRNDPNYEDYFSPDFRVRRL